MAEEPLLASGSDEEVVGDVNFVAVIDLDGFSFNELPAFQGIHGVTGEVSGVAGSHLEAEIARA